MFVHHVVSLCKCNIKYTDDDCGVLLLHYYYSKVPVPVQDGGKKRRNIIKSL